MLDSLFTLAALIGGTVLLFQFVLMLLGLGHDGGDLSGAPSADVGGVDLGGGDFGHVDVGDGDVNGMPGDHTPWHQAADADLGHPGAPWFYEVISLRTLSAAVTFFGLTGKTTLAYGYSPQGAFVLASLAGLAAMYVVYWLFKQVYKLQHTGSENIRNSIGLPATVYVPIPGGRAGAGKVTFRMQNRIVEYQAVTEDQERLKTGEKVVVVAIVNSDTVRVSRASSPVPDMAAST
jgi:hypothetical protein